MGQIAVIVRSAKERKDAPFFLSTKSVGKSHIPIQKDVLVAGLAVQKSERIFPDRPSRRPHNLCLFRKFSSTLRISIAQIKTNETTERSTKSTDENQNTHNRCLLQRKPSPNRLNWLLLIHNIVQVAETYQCDVQQKAR